MANLNRSTATFTPALTGTFTPDVAGDYTLTFTATVTATGVKASRTISFTALNNVLVLSAPKVNNVAVNTTVSSYSVTVVGPLTNASLNVKMVGTPVLAATAQVGFNLTEVGGNRVLQLVIDKVTLANNDGTLTATVPATAKLYAYGKNTAGTTFSVSLTNVAANIFTSTPGQTVLQIA